MAIPHIRRALVGASSMLLAAFAHSASAAVAVHIVRTDLKPLIDAAVDSPVQFAVLVPHRVSTASGGTWSEAGGRATWRYAVQVPTAVSLSFHATQSSLPESATLVVASAKTTTSYRARDLHRGELWSRIQPGEGLEFTLTVAAEDRSKVVLSIVSLQAGYRAIGPGVEDHPYYRRLKLQTAAASGNASCVTNYQCQVSAGNTPPGAATVALIIGNLYQCTGSLINDVPGDNTPFVLTARHCETGQLGGGSPGAASTVTVYWDATTPCSAALGSLYDPGIPTQSGATTIVEQQDVWLIELDVNPIVSDAQFAGFDASGGAVQGGYTIHHAEGNDKQFAGWFGQAAAVQASGVLGVKYLSDFWETVNQTGNIGPGASGSGLFDQSDHLVGALSLGRTTNDPSGYGSCPVANPPAPNGSNGVADFTSLAAVWNSIADTTSTTGNTTLKSVLDPANTGTAVVPSLPAAAITFKSLTTDRITINQTEQFNWSAPNAAQCTASGGIPGDGWSGTLPSVVGTQTLTETAPAVVTYTLTCTFSGGRTAHASLILTWISPATQVQFNAPYAVWTTRPAVLSWTSNNGPCSISGGGLSLTNMAASGTTSTTQTTAGDVTYTITCGPVNNSQTLGTSVLYVTPSLLFEANATDRLLGQPLSLAWATYADRCTPTGGAPNDGWSNSAFNAPTSGTVFSPQITTLGTYTYTLVCSSGPLSVQQSIAVTIENNAPFVKVSFDKTSVTLTDSPADYMTMTWSSNLTVCQYATTPVLNGTSTDPIVNDPIQPQDPVVFAPTAPGTYQVSIACTTGAGTLNMSASSPQVTLTVLPPPPPTAAISLSPATVLQNQNFTIGWSSTDALNCAETGGGPGSIWGAAGPNSFGDPPAGTTISSINEPGTYTFGITCKSIDPNQGTASAQAAVTVNAPSATLTVTPTSVTIGGTLTLTWSSMGASSCTAMGGGANGSPWGGTLAPSGSTTQTASVEGTFTYTLTCTLQAQAQATVTVSAASSAGSGKSGGGGGGGGGTIGLLELALLAALRGVRRRVSPGLLQLREAWA
jgi:hypothetical protein